MFGDDPLLADASPQAALWVVGIYLTLLLAGLVTALVLMFRLTRRETVWAERLRALNARPLTWRDGGLALLAVAALVGLSWLAGYWLKTRGVSDDALIVLQSLAVDGAGLLAIRSLLHRRGLSFRAVFGLTRTTEAIAPAEGMPPATGPAGPLFLEVPSFLGALRRGVTGYLALMPFLVFAALVSQGVLTLHGYSPSLQEVARLLLADHSPAMRAYLLFLAVGLAPVFEETLFRGLLLPLFARRFGLGAGIAITSVAFSAIHLHLFSGAPLFVIAAGFCLAYVYTGSLWVPIAMHSLFNGVNLGLLLAAKNL